jgi:predicted ATP-grasp superfamily ATP-dependent carboligase
MADNNGALPPVILLGGACNALSVARSLGRAGVKVLALNSPGAYVRHSRYCTLLRPPGWEAGIGAWADYLLGPDSEPLRGAVLLACSDTELEFLAHNREPLASKYRLDLSNPQAQLCMLNKLSTYQMARAAGIPLPRFWTPQTREQVESLRPELPFPLLVKPLYSHVYRRRFTNKLVVAQNFEEVVKGYGAARAAGVDVMLVEMIPGPDDRLCSYYTYLDENGEPLFHFTKRIIRRFPPIQGGACYHVTDWIPEVKDVSLRLFQAVGLRGLANAEFKRDQRDGRLKLIECNARFTEGNRLVAASGYDLGLFVYNRIVGRPQPPLGAFQLGKRLWYPVEDYRAFRQLRREGELTWLRWLASLAHRKVLPYFRWDDPLPTLVHELGRLKNAVLDRLGTTWRRAAGLIRAVQPAGTSPAAR